MKKVIIAFDIDGTLRNNTYEYPVGDMQNKIHWNERICNMAITFARFKNVTCIIWSGGGRDYAERVRHEFERDFGKQPFKSAHGKTEPLQPHIAIDDVQACEMGIFNLIVREK